MPDALTDSPLCDGDPLARDFAALRPASTAVTPASVLFAAGEEAALARSQHWRTAAIAMGLIFVGSWVGMTVRPEAKPALTLSPAAPSPPESRHDSNPPTPSPPPTVVPSSRPVPQVLAMEPLVPDVLDARARGLRLRHDILAGGIGLIPTDLNEPTRRLPSGGWFDLNPTVLGGYYDRPKDDEKPEN